LISISIYQPNYLSPNSTTIDNSIDQNFTATMQGSYSDAYSLMIYDMNNNIAFNSSALPLSPVLYQGDEFLYTLPSSSLSNGNQYKWQLQLFSDSLPIQQCFSYNAGTTTYTDETTVANDSTANNMNLIPIATVEDAYYFGSNTKFSGIKLTIGTVGVYVATLVWEYYNSTSSTWISIPILTDNTSGFTQSGMVLFNPPTDWTTVAVNSSTKYWIRCRVSAFASKTTSPLGTQAWSKTSATSRQTPFYCYATSTVSMTVPAEITSKKHTFTSVYAQAESISLNYWNMTFLDSNNEVILTTPNSYSGLISYEFDGFINNQTYKVYTTVTNQQNITVQSSVYTFTVIYASPSLTVIPTATLLPELSAVKVLWSPAVQIEGTVTGTSEYVSNLFTPNNTGLKLDTTTWDSEDTVDDTITFDEISTYDEFASASILLNDLFGKVNEESYVAFEVDIPLIFTNKMIYVADEKFIGGKMIRLENSISGDYYEIGYNSELGCYYYDINGFIINGSNKEFLISPILIGIRNVEVIIIYNNEIYDYIHP